MGNCTKSQKKQPQNPTPNQYELVPGGVITVNLMDIHERLIDTVSVATPLPMNPCGIYVNILYEAKQIFQRYRAIKSPEISFISCEDLNERYPINIPELLIKPGQSVKLYLQASLFPRNNEYWQIKSMREKDYYTRLWLPEIAEDFNENEPI